MMTVDEVLQIVEAFFRELLKVINKLKEALGLKEADADSTEEPAPDDGDGN